MPPTVFVCLPPLARRAAVLLALLPVLAGCGGPDLPQFPPACPETGLLSDAADLSLFRSTGNDLTDLVVDGRLLPPVGKCMLKDLTHLDTQLTVTMDLTRGPAAKGRDVQVTYFVSVSRGDTILNKRDFNLATTFPANSDHIRVSGEPIDLILPVNDKLSGAAYRVLVAFQLTPEELAFNRRRGVR